MKLERHKDSNLKKKKNTKIPEDIEIYIPVTSTPQ
jgi:hypothetical protein